MPRRRPARGSPRRTGTRSPGPAATRLTARAPVSGSRNATIEPGRGQRVVVGSTSSQSPSVSVGSMLAWRMASRHGPRSRWRRDSVRRGPAVRRGLRMRMGAAPVSWVGRRPASSPRRRSSSRRRRSRRSSSSSFLESAASVRRLDLGDLLVRVPEQLVQVRHGLEVLGLEVVVPQDVEVVLDQVGLLLLDGDRAGPEGRVLVGRVLLVDAVDRTRPRCGPARGRRRRTAGRSGRGRWSSGPASGSGETWDSFISGSRDHTLPSRGMHRSVRAARGRVKRSASVRPGTRPGRPRVSSPR